MTIILQYYNLKFYIFTDKKGITHLCRAPVTIF